MMMDLEINFKVKKKNKESNCRGKIVKIALTLMIKILYFLSLPWTALIEYMMATLIF